MFARVHTSFKVLIFIVLFSLAAFTGVSMIFFRFHSSRFFKSLGVDNWVHAYEVMDARINGGKEYAFHLDTIGFLSWRESYILSLYVGSYP